MLSDVNFGEMLTSIYFFLHFRKFTQGKFFDEEAILDELSEKLREVRSEI